MTIAFTDRTAEIFGRRRDLAELLSGCAHPGVMVVSGRPKIGKSWTLTEVARQLQSAQHLVGYAESTGEEADDLLLRSVADAYARWLADAPATAQAKSLYERHKGALIGRAGEAVGKLFKEIAKGGTIEWKMAGELAAGFFSGLAALDRDLKSASLTLPRLSYDAARDLTLLVAKLSGRDVVLILDAWDKSPSTDQELGIVDSYLHHLDDWPSGHVVIGLRIESDSDEKVQRVRRLIASSPAAREYKLPLIDVSEEGERERLLRHARGKLGRAVTEASDEEIECWIAGYPGVLEWWERGAVKKELNSPTDVAGAASDAHAGRYGPEFERVLAPLFEKDLALFGVAVRVALLPELVTESQWDALRPLVLDGQGLQAVTTLQVQGVLDARERRFPSYGHSTRHEAVQRWLITSRYMPFVRQETEGLASALADRIRSVNHQYRPFAVALIALRSAVAATSGSPASAALVEATRSLFRDESVTWEIFVAGLPSLREEGAPTALWAMALSNMMCQRTSENDWVGRDTLLGELRDLATRKPDDAVVRVKLASALAYALTYRGSEGYCDGIDQLLTELRDFTNRHSDDAALREQLAMALFNTFNDRGKEDDHDGRAELLAELDNLANRYPDDAAVGMQLAMALLNILIDRIQGRDRDGSEEVLGKLRNVANRHHNDAAVRKQLAMALVYTLAYRSDVGDHDRSDTLLVELGHLSNRYPDDGTVRKLLADALLHSLVERSADGVRDGGEELLGEIRSLANRHSDDVALRKPLAMALFNTLDYRRKQSDRRGSEELLAELRDLAHQHPDDAAVGQGLAMALFNKLDDRRKERDRDGRDQLLAEIRDLTIRHPEDAVVRESLARALVHTLEDLSDGERDGRVEIRGELHDLANRYPNHAVLQSLLNGGL